MPCYENEALRAIHEQAYEDKRKEAEALDKERKAISVLFNNILKLPCHSSLLEKMRCKLVHDLNEAQMFKHLSQEVRANYMEHRKEDVRYYRSKYNAELHSLLASNSITDEITAKANQLIAKIAEIDKMTEDDLLNRNFEKL